VKTPTRRTLSLRELALHARHRAKLLATLALLLVLGYPSSTPAQDDTADLFDPSISACSSAPDAAWYYQVNAGSDERCQISDIRSPLVDAVWSCTSGDCSTLAAASGDSIDAGSADSSKPATRSTSLPGTCAEGQLHQDTDSGGTETYVCTGANSWTKFGNALQRPSMDNDPATAPDWSCDFSSTICSGSLYGSAGTSTPVSGSISTISSVSGDPLYSYSHVPGSICFQSDESTAQTIGVAWSTSQSTQQTWLVKLSGQNRVISADPEGTLALRLENSGDSNEELYMAAYKNASSLLPWLQINNNGSGASSTGGAVAEGSLSAGAIYLAIWKDGNTYWGGYATARDGVMSPLGSLTKTGVTTFDTLKIVMYTANETPSAIFCVDFARSWNSLKFDFVNE